MSDVRALTVALSLAALAPPINSLYRSDARGPRLTEKQRRKKKIAKGIDSAKLYLSGRNLLRRLRQKY